MSVPTVDLSQAAAPKLASIGALHRDAWHTFTYLFLKFLLIFVFTILPAVIIFALGALDQGRHLAITIAIIVMVLLSGILFLLGQVAILYAIKNPELSAWQAFKMGFRRLHSAIWVTFCVNGIVLLWTLVAVLIPILLFVLMRVYVNSAGYTGGSALALIVNILLGIWVFLGVLWIVIRINIRYFFSLYVLVDQDLRGTTTLFASNQYTKGVILKIFWRILVPLIIFFLPYLALSYFFDKLMPGSSIPGIILSVLQGLFMLYLVTYTFQMYQSVKALKGPQIVAPTKGQRDGMVVGAFIGILIAFSAFFAGPLLLLWSAFSARPDISQKTLNITENTSQGDLDVESATVSSRDTQRIDDMYQMMIALDLYQSNIGSYPAADSNGFPIGLAPEYIDKIPKAPIPPDGACTPTQNYYIYSSNAPHSDFMLTFCLGDNAEGFEAGVHYVDQGGIH